MFRKRLWAFQETLKPLEGHTERILKRAKEYCEVSDGQTTRSATRNGWTPPRLKVAQYGSTRTLSRFFFEGAVCWQAKRRVCCATYVRLVELSLSRE